MSNHNVKINNKAYIINPFKGIKGFKIQAKLLKIVSSGIGALGTGSENGDEPEIDNLMAGIKLLLTENDVDDIFKLIEEIISDTQTLDGSIDFDKEFSQNYLALFELIKEIILFNYKDVFQKLGISVG